MSSSDNLVKTTEGGKRRRRAGVSMITNISMRGVLFVCWLVIRITW